MTYKIYTKQGDKGKTSIIGQNRIDKHDVRIEAYGSVDELNSYLGLLRSMDEVKSVKLLYNIIIKSQNNLFKIGSYLAQTKEKRQKNQEFLILNNTILDLEDVIDKMEKEIPPITRFVLPGGNLPSSHFQIARAICRRAERRITFFHKKEQLDDNLLVYINRLSDFLFVSARFLIFKSNENELFWEK